MCEDRLRKQKDADNHTSRKDTKRKQKTKINENQSAILSLSPSLRNTENHYLFPKARNYDGSICDPPSLNVFDHLLESSPWGIPVKDIPVKDIVEDLNDPKCRQYLN